MLKSSVPMSLLVLNMLERFVTLEVFQWVMSTEVNPPIANIQLISVTFDVSNVTTSGSDCADAFLNILLMLVTLLVSKSIRMVAAFDVSNIEDISVVREDLIPRRSIVPYIRFIPANILLVLVGK